MRPDEVCDKGFPVNELDLRQVRAQVKWRIPSMSQHQTPLSFSIQIVAQCETVFAWRCPQESTPQPSRAICLGDEMDDLPQLTLRPQQVWVMHESRPSQSDSRTRTHHQNRRNSCHVGLSTPTRHYNVGVGVQPRYRSQRSRSTRQTRQIPSPHIFCGAL